MTGQHAPGGTVVSSINYCTGHNPHIWGRGLEEFNPDRLVKGERADQNMVMAFAAGHRVCIARNTAMMSRWKVSATLLRNYEFTPMAGAIGGKIEIRSRGYVGAGGRAELYHQIKSMRHPGRIGLVSKRLQHPVCMLDQSQLATCRKVQRCDC